MTPEMMCITDLDGRKLAGDRDPSSEMQMHLEVYRRRPDVQAVVHAHPPIATGFAVAGIPLDRAVLAEVVLHARQCADRRVRHPVHEGTARRRSGSTSRRTTACCWPITARSRSARICSPRYYKMETIEHFANISLVARLLGGERLLSREEVVPAAGPARALRHCGAGADLRGSRAGGRGRRLPGGPGAVGARPTSGARPRGVSRRSGGPDRAAHARARAASLPTVKFG